MSVRVWYPNEFGDSPILDSQMEVGQFWRDYGNQISILKPFLQESTFFGRFLVFVNGIRVYRWAHFIHPDDTVLIIAANKLSFVPNAPPVCSPRATCTTCGSQDVVYTNIRSVLANCENLCSECFIRLIEETAYGNLAQYGIEPGAIIDFGWSGERDSTVALHLLQNYRDLSAIPFAIHAVFNEIGLGVYDTLREAAVNETVFRKSQWDRLRINRLALPLISENLNSQAHTVGLANPCDVCSEGHIFRPFGLYFEGNIYSCGGGPTVEDRITASLISPMWASPKTKMDYSLPSFQHRKWLSILEGISEDCISIYAALKRINYCIADCPLANQAEAYKCRLHVLNSYRALMPNYTEITKGLRLHEEHTLWGQVASERHIIHPGPWFWCRECGDYHYLGGRTVQDAFNRKNLPIAKANNLTDSYKKLAKVYSESEDEWLESTVGNYEVCGSPHLNVSMKPKQGVCFHFGECFVLKHDNVADVITLIPTTKREQQLLRLLQNTPRHVDLNDVLLNETNKERRLILKAIQKWIALDLVDVRIGKEDSSHWPEKRKTCLTVVDDAGLFQPEDFDLIKEGLFNSREIIVSIITDWQSKKLKHIFKNDLTDIVIAAATNQDVFHHLDRLAKEFNFMGDTIFIYPGDQISVAMGCFRCLANQSPRIENGQKMLEKYSLAVRLRIIGVLLEMYDLDNCSNILGWRNKNIVYYMNPQLGTKKKELSACTCTKHGEDAPGGSIDMSIQENS